LSLRKIPIFGGQTCGESGQTMSDMVTIPEALGQLPSGKRLQFAMENHHAIN